MFVNFKIQGTTINVANCNSFYVSLNNLCFAFQDGVTTMTFKSKEEAKAAKRLIDKQLEKGETYITIE